LVFEIVTSSKYLLEQAPWQREFGSGSLPEFFETAVEGGGGDARSPSLSTFQIAAAPLTSGDRSYQRHLGGLRMETEWPLSR